jgi:hypothetical protein
MPWVHKEQWRYSSTILDLVNKWRWVMSFTSRQLYPQGKSPGTDWIGVWVGLRTDMDAVEKRRISNRCQKSIIKKQISEDHSLHAADMLLTLWADEFGAGPLWDKLLIWRRGLLKKTRGRFWSQSSKLGPHGHRTLVHRSSCNQSITWISDMAVYGYHMHLCGCGARMERTSVSTNISEWRRG